LYTSTGTLQMINTTLSMNAAQGGGGGQGGSGTILKIVPFSYGGGKGGGLYTSTGTLQMINTTLSTNAAQEDGGGGQVIRIHPFDTPGGNGGNGQGGGVYDNSNGQNNYLNDTVAENSAMEGKFGTGGSNGGKPGDQGSASGGGIFVDVDASAPTLINNLLEKNQADPFGGMDYNGAASSADNNNFVPFFVITGFFNKTNILGNSTNQLDTLHTSLTGLAFYPLIIPSMVIDQGDNSVLSTIARAEGVSTSQATDELGHLRLVNTIIDIGAVEFQPTSVSVASASTQFSFAAQNVPLSATVTGPEGTLVNEGQVQFVLTNLAGSPLGQAVTANVINGQASAQFVLPASTPHGDYTITAIYTDVNPGSFGPSTGTGTLTVSPDPTTASVASASTSFSYAAQNVPLSATIAPTNPDPISEGKVTFTVFDDNVNQVGSAVSAPVVNGLASTQFVLPAGTHHGKYTITASYTDLSPGNFSTSTGTGMLTVSRADTSISVSDPELPFPPGDPHITVSATISSPGAAAVNEGQVSFAIPALSVTMSAPVLNGQASVNLAVPANTPVGTYTITATYTDGSPGDFQGITGTNTLTVTPAPTTTTINNVSIVYTLMGEQETLTAVTRDAHGVPANSGIVQFTDGGISATAPIINGVATVTLNIPLFAENPFAHSIALGYSDNAGNFFPNTGLSTLDQTIMDFLFQIMALELLLQSASANA
jgi:hypothetical protein